MPSGYIPSGSPFSSTRSAVSRAASWESLSFRSMGTWPTEEKNHFWIPPANPGVVKYSFFARNVSWRFESNGKYSESITARWFEARITGPSEGILSRPRANGRL
ncbi:hypothetical protein BJF89_07015 [Corynebacterium sp. CNJ-954]|nr:hypothetical protein BJF89_07015 [Corynebacterium sp. CNJ-954]